MPSFGKRVDTTAVYRDGALGLRVDLVELAGEVGPVKRCVVEYHPACALVALDGTRSRLLLTRQYRYPVGRDLLEIPGGMMEPGESVEACAARELEEETGHRVLGSVSRLLSFYPEPAFADHQIHLLGAVVSDQPPADFQRDPDVHATIWVSLADALQHIEDGEIASSWSVIGILSTIRSLQEGAP